MDALVDASQTTPMKPAPAAAAALGLVPSPAPASASVPMVATAADDAKAADSTGLPVLAADRPFADACNYADCIRYLNSALQSHGFETIDWPAVCAAAMPTTTAADAASAISAADSVTAKVGALNTLYRLVVAQQHALEQRTDSSAKYDALMVRATELNTKLTHTANELHAAHHKGWAAENKRRASEVEFKKIESKLRGAVRELETRNVQIQRRDKQYLHEMRKREKEYRFLQDKVTKLLSEKGAKDAKTWELINTLKASTLAAGASSSSSTGNPHAALHERTVALYESRLHEVGQENHDLRTTLRSLQQELCDALNGYVVARPGAGGIAAGVGAATTAAAADVTAAVDTTTVAGTGTGTETASTAATTVVAGSAAAAAQSNAARVMGLPFRLIQSDVEGGARAKIALLREKMAKLNATADASAAATTTTTGTSSAGTAADATVSAETVAHLQRTIAEQQQLIAEQDALLQSALFAPGGPAPASATTAALLVESRRWSLMAEAEDEQRRKQQQRLATAATTVAKPQSQQQPQQAQAMTPRSAANATVLAAVTSHSSSAGTLTNTSRLLAQALREADDPSALVPVSPLPASSGAVVPPTPQFVYAQPQSQSLAPPSQANGGLPPPHTPVRRLQFVVTPKKISPPAAKQQQQASQATETLRQPALVEDDAEVERDENAAPSNANANANTNVPTVKVVDPSVSLLAKPTPAPAPVPAPALVVVDDSHGGPDDDSTSGGSSALERMEITSRGVTTTVEVAIDAAADHA